MLGAILGDIIGSIYEYQPIKTKDFELLTPDNHPTDDTIMTVAVGLVTASREHHEEEEYKRNLVKFMRLLGKEFPDAGYGMRFSRWLCADDSASYHSYLNRSAMRFSPVGWFASSLAEAEQLARWSAEVTHDHPDGVRGAQAVAAAIYMARTAKDIGRIRGYISSYYFPLDFRLNKIRPSYSYDETSTGSVPQAIECFLESSSYEDAVRNAVSLGGDADTQACIAGSIAEAYYGIPAPLQKAAMTYMDQRLTRLFLAYATRLYQRARQAAGAKEG